MPHPVPEVMFIRITSPEAHSASQIDKTVVTYEVGQVYQVQYFTGLAFLRRQWAIEVEPRETVEFVPIADDVTPHQAKADLGTLPDAEPAVAATVASPGDGIKTTARPEASDKPRPDDGKKRRSFKAEDAAPKQTA